MWRGQGIVKVLKEENWKNKVRSKEYVLEMTITNNGEEKIHTKIIKGQNTLTLRMQRQILSTKPKTGMYTAIFRATTRYSCETCTMNTKANETLEILKEMSWGRYTR